MDADHEQQHRHLAELAAVLGTGGWATDLTSPDRPTQVLRVSNPHERGLATELVCSLGDGGAFAWKDSVQPIGSIADLETVASAVKRVLQIPGSPIDTIAEWTVSSSGQGLAARRNDPVSHYQAGHGALDTLHAGDVAELRALCQLQDEVAARLAEIEAATLTGNHHQAASR